MRIASIIVFLLVLSGNAQGSDLIRAAKMGQIGKVKSLLKNGGDINFLDPSGRSALSYAVQKDNVELVRLLLRRGADANKFAREGQNPAAWSAYNGNVEILRLLIDNDVNLDAKGIWISRQKGPSGETPLTCAARRGNLRMGKLLVKNGADPMVRNSLGQTALYEAINKGNAEFLAFLADAGADVNFGDGDEDGASLVIHAAMEDNIEAVNILLDKGARIDESYESAYYTHTVLTEVAYRGHWKTAERLAKAGANINHAISFMEKAVEINRDIPQNASSVIKAQAAIPGLRKLLRKYPPATNP